MTLVEYSTKHRPIYVGSCETAQITGPRASLDCAFTVRRSGRVINKVEGCVFQKLTHQ